ncbi:MAG: DNA polymerase III subunit delta [Mariprofundaceae bacterium]|nr:DNA polymerase III subunit delta [Mariprofundaceae bacterium]
MSLKLPPAKLFPVAHACYYLSGDDEDGVFETAELLLQDGTDGATVDGITILRVDVNELALIHQNLQPGLFGEARCHALVRNAGSARPKQIDQLEQLAADPPGGLRLIICAAAIEAKKVLHKRLTALPDIVCCAIPRMDEAAFGRWLIDVSREAGIKLSDEATALLGEQLLGMRMAARQAVERLRLFDAGEGAELDVEVVGDLLGERSPRDLSALCTAVGERSPQAVGLLRGLLREQQVAEVQVLGWLSTRLQQLLMFAWFEKSDQRTAANKAGVFGAARYEVPKQVKNWQPQQLMRAMQRMVEVEMLLKGASLEAKSVVLERFVAELVTE